MTFTQEKLPWIMLIVGVTVLLYFQQPKALLVIWIIPGCGAAIIFMAAVVFRKLYDRNDERRGKKK